MKKKLRLKKKVRVALIISGLLVIAFLVISSINKVREDNKRAIETCIQQTNNKTYCEREFYGVY